jgi:predicted acetyltransferase
MRTAVLEPVSFERAPVLRNLFELYCYDFSERVPLDLAPSGRFEIPLGDEWWSEGHFAYFIRDAGKLLGFALARRGSRLEGGPDVMDVAEFFVVRGARRSGVGTRAAHELFEALPGRWEVRVRASNEPAQAFWSQAVRTWLGRDLAPEPFTRDGVAWQVLRLPAR